MRYSLIASRREKLLCFMDLYNRQRCPISAVGLNGSTQHLLEAHALSAAKDRSRALIQAEHHPGQARLITAGHFGSLQEALSDHQLKECCIDRLSWQRLPGM
jgi:hypothetical protein